MNTPTRRIRWSAAILTLAAVVLPQTTLAQASDAEWVFSPMGPFADERVQLSMRLQMDADTAASAAGITLNYAGAGELPPAEDADILLAAAGLAPPDGGPVTGIIIERPCRAWAANDALTPAAQTLGAELSRVWAQYGVDFAPCSQTDDPTLADILVFEAGQPPGEVDLMAARSEGSFLGFATPSGNAGGPGGAAGAGDGGGDPAPAQGGSLGEARPASSLAMVVGLIAALTALIGGRRLTGVRPS